MRDTRKRFLGKPATHIAILISDTEVKVCRRQLGDGEARNLPGDNWHFEGSGWRLLDGIVVEDS